MLRFKQFLAEMPYLSTNYDRETSSYDMEDSFSKLPDGAHRIGEIEGTKNKYDLYKHRHSVNGKPSRIVNFLAVHRETGKVHMRVSGNINDDTNEFHVDVLRSAHPEHRERAMGRHFYSAITQHHTVVSDTQHSKGSYQLYHKLARSGAKMSVFTPEKDTPDETPLDRSKDFRSYYSTHYSAPQTITAFKLHRKK